MSRIISGLSVWILWIVLVFQADSKKLCNVKNVNGTIHYKFLDAKDYEAGCDPNAVLHLAVENMEEQEIYWYIKLRLKFDQSPNMTIRLGTEGCNAALLLFEESPYTVKIFSEFGQVYVYDLELPNVIYAPNSKLRIQGRPYDRILCGLLMRQVANYTIFDLEIFQDRPTENVSLTVECEFFGFKLLSEFPIKPPPKPTPAPQPIAPSDFDFFTEYNEYWWLLSLSAGFLGGIFLAIGVLLMGLFCVLDYPTPDRDPEMILFGEKPKDYKYNANSTDSTQPTAEERERLLKRRKKPSKNKK